MRTVRDMATHIEASLGAAGLARLMAWLSPAFPVGGYTYSHGVERAIEEGAITNGETLRVWIEGALEWGPARVDADLLRESWRAVAAEDERAFVRALTLGEIMRGTPELALESRQQGESFLTTVAATWPNAAMARWVALVRAEGRAIAYPVAVGLASAIHGIPLEATLPAYLQAFAASLVSAAVRLVPLGQTVGQATLARLEPIVAESAAASLARTLDQLGSAAPTIDLLSIAHETQHMRLFRS
jgi:urease accessory protein